jgi:putative transposase
VAEKWISKGHKARKVLKMAKCSHSTYYHRRRRKKRKKDFSGGRPIPGYSLNRNGTVTNDSDIKKNLMYIIEGEGFYYGYRKLTYCLRRRFGMIINRKKVYRLCKELQILRPQRELNRTFPRKLARNRLVTGPNQVWEIDVKYGFIAGEDRFFFIASVLDVFDRSIIGYHMGTHCKSDDIAYVLKEAIVSRGNCHPVIRTDNGTQFTAFNFEDTCSKLKLEHERIPFKTPDKIAHIEAFHRILEDECLGQDFANYAEAYSTVAAFMKFYNSERIHSSLGFMSPDEFAKCHKNVKVKDIWI